jgi:ABC-type sulfate transport system permease subunit
MTAQDHNKTLGILFLIFGSVNILLLIPVALQTTQALKGIEDNAALSPNPESVHNAMGLLMILLIVLGVFSLASSIMEIVAGFGLFKRQTWAPAAATIAAIVSLINLPIGTVLGIYALWFLFGSKGRNFYCASSSIVSQTPPQ